MSKKQVALRGTAKKLVDEFDEATQLWGWERDQGSPASANAAELDYFEKKAALVRYIERLQTKSAKVRKLSAIVDDAGLA